MRIAVGGIMHESNTFSATRTDRSQFIAGSLTFGDALEPVWREAHHEMGGFLAGAAQLDYEVVPTVMAWATPGGPVDDGVFDELTAELISRCCGDRIDGVLVALHGAMVTPQHCSADGEVLRRLRAALGPMMPIAATLDFHANVSAAMIEHASLLVGYQTYPHTDQKETGMVAASLLTRTIRGEIRPIVSYSKCQQLINLLGQETDREPMRTLLAQAREIERQPPLLTVSLMAGFPYADVPDTGASVIAVADNSQHAAQAVADCLSQRLFERRHDLCVECPDAANAVRAAMNEPETPVLLVDLGDNIGGGSPGDGTVLLAELLSQEASGFVVVLFAPEAVQIAIGAGVGRPFAANVGGATGRLSGEPVRIRGTVRGVHNGRWVEEAARHGGRRQNDQGPTAVIDLGKDNIVVLNSLRTPPFSLGQLTSLGIDPSRARVIVVKAAVAYKAAYGPVARTIIAVDTPGLTAVNFRRFDFRHVRRPIFPLDEFDAPILSGHQ